jgi:alpha-tubulin suppressor-like RCC1 family protein
LHRRSFFVAAAFGSFTALGVVLGAGCGDSGDEAPAAEQDSGGRPADAASERTSALADAGIAVDARPDALDASDASDGSDASDASDANVPDAPPLTDETVISLAGGAEMMCVLRNDGKVKCWGSANFLGLGIAYPDNRGDNAAEMGSALPFVDLGTGVRATALFGGSYAYHHCALLDTGALRCWGTNTNGELGGDLASAAKPYRGDAPGEMGDHLPAVDLGTGRHAVRVSTTNAHACAVLDNGKVKCWGNNASGELGLGDSNSRGDAAGEMGDDLPYVDLGTGRTAVAVHTANARSCAITDEARVKCWGAGTNGQLGQGSTSSRGATGGQLGDALPYIALGTGRTVLAVTGGLTFACALLDDHSVKCWGYNQFGELGLGDKNDRGDGAGEMGDALPAVNLGVGRTAKAIASGAEHTCAILDNDQLKCWGSNNQGQLGYGDTNPRGDASGEMANLPYVDLGTGRTVKQIALQASSTCALLDNGQLKCWGYNAYGQLGIGSADRKGAAANEMGDQLPAVDLGP